MCRPLCISLHCQEVDNWTALMADVDEVFASQDVGKMAARIQGMQQSLVRRGHCMIVLGGEEEKEGEEEGREGRGGEGRGKRGGDARRH